MTSLKSYGRFAWPCARVPPTELCRLVRLSSGLLIGSRDSARRRRIDVVMAIRLGQV